MNSNDTRYHDQIRTARAHTKAGDTVVSTTFFKLYFPTEAHTAAHLIFYLHPLGRREVPKTATHMKIP